jgi:hypothetical protein
MRSAVRLARESAVMSIAPKLQLQTVTFYDLGSTFHDVVAQDEWF